MWIGLEGLKGMAEASFEEKEKGQWEQRETAVSVKLPWLGKSSIMFVSQEKKKTAIIEM